VRPLALNFPEAPVSGGRLGVGSSGPARRCHGRIRYRAARRRAGRDFGTPLATEIPPASVSGPDGASGARGSARRPQGEPGIDGRARSPAGISGRTLVLNSAGAPLSGTHRWGRAQPDPLATQGCTYPRPSAAGQTGTSYDFGRPRGGGWIDIRLSPSRHGLAKVRIVRLGSLDAFVGRDGSSPSSPRLVKEPVAARQNMPLISSPDFLTQEIRGNRDHTQTRPDRQINGRFPYKH
jgi:hypothetical protein